MERVLPHPDPFSSDYGSNVLLRSAYKSVVAGVAGARERAEARLDGVVRGAAGERPAAHEDLPHQVRRGRVHRGGRGQRKEGAYCI